MLLKVTFLDYRENYNYAPPRRDAVINLDDVVSAVPTDARGPGPFTLVRFRDGKEMTLVGKPDMLLAAERPG